MSNLISRLSPIFLWIIFLAVITSCQSHTDVGSAQPIEVTPGPTLAVERPFTTVSLTPDRQDKPADNGNPYDAFPYKIVDDFDKSASYKLSGIVFHPRRQTLFAVTDNGRIIEIDTDRTFIHKKEIRKKADFEGITYNPFTEMLYIAVEGEDIIVEVNPKTLEVERDIPVNRTFEGKSLLSPDGNGIEGITFVPALDKATNGTFYLVNQSKELAGTDPSIVFEVEINHPADGSQARIIRYFSVGVTDLSGIQYVPSSRRLLIISDANNRLLEVSLTGQVLKTYQLPGRNQEGITIDGNGFLYIAQDSKKLPLKFMLLD